MITGRCLERFWSITPGSTVSGVTNYDLVVEIGDDNFLDLSDFYATEEPRNNQCDHNLNLWPTFPVCSKLRIGACVLD